MYRDILIILAAAGILVGAVSAALHGYSKMPTTSLLSLALMFQSWLLFLAVK